MSARAIALALRVQAAVMAAFATKRKKQPDIPNRNPWKILREIRERGIGSSQKKRKMWSVVVRERERERER